MALPRRQDRTTVFVIIPRCDTSQAFSPQLQVILRSCDEQAQECD